MKRTAFEAPAGQLFSLGSILIIGIIGGAPGALWINHTNVYCNLKRRNAMGSKNVDMVRAAHESWNRRDFDGVVQHMADNLTYTDNARGETFNSKQKFREWVEMWAKAFSNGKIVNPQYIDAGDTVVAQFTVEGTNDGPFAGMPATGRRSSNAFCEIIHFDKSGRVTSGSVYYDQYKTLSELGHVQPLTRAA